MRVRRHILATLLALYAIYDALGVVYATSLNFHWSRVTREMERFAPLATSMNVFQVLAGWIAVILLFAAAFRLARGRRSLGYYAAGLALSVGYWLSLKSTDVYDRTFTPAEQQFDYLLLAIMTLFGLAIWFIERRAARTAKA